MSSHWKWTGDGQRLLCSIVNKTGVIKGDSVDRSLSNYKIFIKKIDRIIRSCIQRPLIYWVCSNIFSSCSCQCSGDHSFFCIPIFQAWILIGQFRIDLAIHLILTCISCDIQSSWGNLKVRSSEVDRIVWTCIYCPLIDSINPNTFACCSTQSPCDSRTWISIFQSWGNKDKGWICIPIYFRIVNRCYIQGGRCDCKVSAYEVDRIVWSSV